MNDTNLSSFIWSVAELLRGDYAFPLNRQFHVFKPPRRLAEIDGELNGFTDGILKMIGRLSK